MGKCNERVLYMCDQKAACKVSPICGKECRMTHNPAHSIDGKRYTPFVDFKGDIRFKEIANGGNA